MRKSLFLSTFVLAVLFSFFFHSQKLQAAEPQSVEVKIDAAMRGEPLTELIYGQFIEHLGRCIYGGIWAEMLEDRKFYYSVGDKDSPWTATPDTDLVMSRKNVFVGEHTPRIILGAEADRGTLMQSKITLQKDRKYQGYVWLKCVGNVNLAHAVLWFSKKGGNSNTMETLVLKRMQIENSGDYYRQSFEFTSPVDSEDCFFGIDVAGGGNDGISPRSQSGGSVYIGTVSLMPADNVHGMRADTLALLKELDSPIYRWPGGNFVSGYDWKDGVGDRDKRPPRKNPAWKGVEHNDFGVNEFMQFCKILGTEPYIAVNTGDGDVENAIAELQYVNGKTDTQWGKLRAEHGHAEPYNVKWWGIGNEMYGDWQIGHMPVADYVKKNNTFVDAFRKEDPSVRLIAVGAVGKWDEAFLPGAANHMDDISEHFYIFNDTKDVAEHVKTIPDSIRRISEAHRKYRETMPELQGKNIKIALDEWNYWYGPHPFGELGTRYFVKDGLGIAAGLHQFARDSELYVMANYAQTVNVIGCIKTSKTAAQFETTGLVLKLYRKEFGSIPVATEVENSPMDVQAALTGDGRYLTVGIVNPLGDTVTLKLTGLTGKYCDGKGGKRFEIVDPQNDPLAFNDPGEPQRIDIQSSDLMIDDGQVHVKPYSVTILKIAQ